MSYIDLNWDFSQFDRDNAARHQAAGFIVNANMIAGRILESRDARKAAHDLEAADAAVGQAKSAMAAHDYTAAWRAARSAYESVLAWRRPGEGQGDRELQRLGGSAEGEAQGPAEQEQRRHLRRLRQDRSRHQALPALGLRSSER